MAEEREQKVVPQASEHIEGVQPNDFTIPANVRDVVAQAGDAIIRALTVVQEHPLPGDQEARTASLIDFALGPVKEKWEKIRW